MQENKTGAPEIVPYSLERREDFRRLNLEWIERYFRVEPEDEKALNDPEGSIIKPGGEIVFARWEGEVVGTCALKKVDEETYELAKMAVTPKAQGHHIGELLGRAVIARARERGAASVILETNDIMVPAVRLYEKLGFIREPHPYPSAYARSNTFMRLHL